MSQRTQHILQLPGGPSASVAIPVSSDCTCYWSESLTSISVPSGTGTALNSFPPGITVGTHDPSVLRLQWLRADFPTVNTTGIRALARNADSITEGQIVPGISTIPDLIELQPVHLWRIMIPSEEPTAWLYQNSGFSLFVAVTTFVWDMCGCVIPTIPCS